jgi:hypothetical protein
MKEQKDLPGIKVEKRRRKPYVWPSWITKLLAGEDQCLWKVWYKVTHHYAKRPDEPGREDFFREYNEKHDAIVRVRAQELRDAGYVVKVEEEGAFKLEGETADVAGKPDIVAIKDREVIVSDAKSGKPRASDHWQVLLYELALVLSWLGPGYDIKGEVQYRARRDEVRPLGDAERKKIVAMIKKVSSKEEPAATPSQYECRYCDVAACPVRYEVPVGDASELF